MTAALLPVDPHWRCQRSGECCTKPDGVVMTHEEQLVVQQAAERVLPIAQLVRMAWTPVAQGFVMLRGQPCPLYADHTCLIHDERPYACRRFACLRPDVESEPLRMMPLSPVLLYGQIGCSNLRDRLLHSRVARRLYARIQRKAQRWARRHGWRES